MIPNDTYEELIHKLNRLRGPNTATVWLCTEVKINKAGKDIFGLIHKISRNVVRVNEIYENVVNDQRIIEDKNDSFEAGPGVWGEHIDELNSCLVLHNNCLYLQYILVEHDRKPYFLDIEGLEVEKDVVKPYIYKQSLPTNQGLDEVVRVRRPKFNSILKIEMKNRIIYERE